jgi:hexulose-6-phosphate isomerase
LAEKEGITISSVASALYWSYSFTSASEKKRLTAISIAKKQLDAAVLLGADTILVVPGAVGVDFIPGCEVVDYDVAYERALDAMRELAGYAEERKVHIGLENVWNKFLLSPLEMRMFIDSIGSEYVGAYLDIGNVIYLGYPEQWVRILGSRIKKVHSKDYRRDVGSAAGFVDLLSGDVNYPAVIEALRAVGYESFVSAEMIYGPLGSLTVPEAQRNFATRQNLPTYAEKIARLKAGGAKLVTVFGVGRTFHIAFWEPHFAAEFGSVEEWKKQTHRLWGQNCIP